MDGSMVGEDTVSNPQVEMRYLVQCRNTLGGGTQMAIGILTLGSVSVTAKRETEIERS